MLEFTSLETWIFIFLVVVATAGFLLIAGRQFRVVREGRSDPGRLDNPGMRLFRVVKEVLLQSRVVGGRPVVGTFHAAVFLAFLLFILETTSMFLEPFRLGYLHALMGDALPAFRLVVMVAAGVCALSMTALAFRRFVLIRYSPDPTSYESGFVALLIVLLMLTYIDLNGTQLVAARVNWWLHVVIILGFPSLILNSKHRHIFLAPFNVFLRTSRLWDVPKMNLDFESMEDDAEITLGLETIHAIPWKLRLDFLSCVECKRCSDQCPAAIAGQELRPADFIKAGQKAILGSGGDDPVIGTIISEKALGQCTSCMACENICPVGIEHSQVLSGAKYAQTLALGTGGVATEFLKAMNNTGNPFSSGAEVRSELISSLGIPVYEKGETEYLLWLGCIWSHNPDFRKVVTATCTLLNKAGVSWGVLETESCSGHHSRRQGEEMQFQMLAEENCERFGELGVHRIITGCPHCLNTFRHEYRDFSGGEDLDVIHHSELFADLIASGVLEIRSGTLAGRKVTYHDPCYLGRYEGVFDKPRDLIGAAGGSLVETDPHRARSYCCGGGAAGFVIEAEGENRVDQERKHQIEEAGVDMLVTSCPECRMMLAGTLEETKDVAELLIDALTEP
ncbi:heterodisulfide reductase-related iron-sulfur binding cluster [Gemmatimonadota bacterium]